MVASFSIESDVQKIKEKRHFTDFFLGELATLCRIPASSQTRISQALRGAKPFSNEHEPLRTLVLNIDALCESVAPIPVALDNPALIKTLLDSFLKTQQTEVLIRPCYVIEFSDDHSLFEGIRDNIVRRTLNRENAIPLQDRVVATAAVDALDKMGYRTLAHRVRMRVAESQIARTLHDVGFVQGGAA